MLRIRAASPPLLSFHFIAALELRKQLRYFGSLQNVSKQPRIAPLAS
jgi:hypothetical protein